ncbi:hypothetical protein F-S17_0136 [Faustovirus]|nr:hypothetical protein F-S17_0136 [Faustovirus]
MSLSQGNPILIHQLNSQVQIGFEVIQYFELDNVGADAVLVLSNNRVVLEGGDACEFYPDYAICLHGDEVKCIRTVNLRIPYGNDGKNRVYKQLLLQNNDRVAFYSGGYKMICNVKILHPTYTHVTITDVSIVIRLLRWISEIDIKTLSKRVPDPICDHVTTNTPPSRTQSGPILESVPAPETLINMPQTVPQAEPSAAKATQTEYTVEIKIKREKWYGVPCWSIPSALGGSLQITFDREIVGKTLIERRRKDGHAVARTLRAINPTNTNTVVIVATETYQFWIVDEDNDVYPVNIKDVKV